MKYGIYYAYWENTWGGQFVPYVQKVKKLGFDILEVACGAFYQRDDAYFQELRKASEVYGIRLTGGYGPRREHNLAAVDTAQLKATFAFYADMFRKMELAGINWLGGALYSYWPIDKSAITDKPGDFDRSAANMRILADMANDHGIALGMEVLNRFEGYLLNECYEAVEYVKAVGKDNVKVMLDTFHMNIEEDSFTDAIRLAGGLLGHVHAGEANRRPPYAKGRIPWLEIGSALHEIGYHGSVVMEPFVKMGGEVGRDIFIWRDLSHGATEAQLDEAVAESVAFLRGLWR